MQNIIINVITVSCFISLIFVIIRIYFCYFSKIYSETECDCNDEKPSNATIAELPKTETKPKRTRKPKSISTKVDSKKPTAKKQPTIKQAATDAAKKQAKKKANSKNKTK